MLVGRLLEREVGRERLVGGAVDVDRQAGTRLALGLDLQQLGGDVVDLLGSLLLGLGPLLAPEAVQRRGLRRGAGVAVDQVQLADRHVEAVALGVLDLDELVLLAAGLQRHQPPVAADAMVLVDDRRPVGQLAQVADDGFRLPPGPLPPPRLRSALGEQLALGEDGELGLVEGEAVFERGHGDGELPFSRLREKVPRRGG